MNKKKQLERFTRFVVVGGIATATQYLILIGLVELLGAEPVISSAIGFVLSSLVNYRLNYSFTFRSDLPHGTALPKFFLTALLGLTLNTVSMYVMVNYLHVFYILSQVVATGITLLFNFTVHSLWSFRESGE